MQRGVCVCSAQSPVVHALSLRLGPVPRAHSPPVSEHSRGRALVELLSLPLSLLYQHRKVRWTLYVHDHVLR
jgi:hypothetical protein